MFELQSLPSPLDEASRELYWVSQGASKASFVFTNDTMLVPRGVVIDGGTYFNSFYASWWLTYTNVRKIALTFRLWGNVRVRLICRDRLGTENIMAVHERSGDGDTVRLPALDLAQGDSMRVFPQFEVLSYDASLADIAWMTETPPLREVKLAAAICTYNRENDIAAILTALEPLQDDGAIAEIIVINHGKAKLESRLQRNMKLPSSCMVVDQANLGGSGGFARGMLEALANKENTHLLLLDDDVRIDARIIRRMPVLLARSYDQMAVGGAMLDRLRPLWLHNNVTRLDEARCRVEPMISNADLGAPEMVDAFTPLRRDDFCGWWCCALPLSALVKTKLPLPLFIHYDDAEFGLRLRAAGIASLSWPGLAVWHEPFYIKAAAWRRYYDFRNVLFLLAYHNKLDGRVMRRELIWRFFINIKKHDYAAAWATLQAMDDFYIGPKLLAAWNEKEHMNMVALTCEWGHGEALALDLSKLLKLVFAFFGVYRRSFSSCAWELSELRHLGTKGFWLRKLGLG